MSHGPVIVSFSGIDGAGKSTQIEALCQFLSTHEHRWKLYRFWDDVVAFSGLREQCSLRLFRGEKGIGSPERPIQRRDKNVTSWPVRLLRLFLYTADALRLRAVIGSFGRGADFVIFDRYIYDEWANLPLRHWAIRFYIRSLARIVPKPDVAVLLDAEPIAATKRKPEYPLDFVQRNRSAYLQLAQIVGMTTVPPQSVEGAARSISTAVCPLLRAGSRVSMPSESLAGEPRRERVQAGQGPFFSTTSSH